MGSIFPDGCAVAHATSVTPHMYMLCDCRVVPPCIPLLLVRWDTLLLVRWDYRVKDTLLFMRWDYREKDAFSQCECACDVGYCLLQRLVAKIGGGEVVTAVVTAHQACNCFCFCFF